MTCIKPDYEPVEINRIQDLEKLLKETKFTEGLGPACVPIKSPAEQKDLQKHDAPCPLYINNSAALYRTSKEEIA